MSVPSSSGKSSNCDSPVASLDNSPSFEECAQKACELQANVVQMFQDHCEITVCRYGDLELTDIYGAADIYVLASTRK